MPLPMAQPSWTNLAKRLESTFRKALFDFNLLDGVSKVGVALSGGKDSLALLHLLSRVSGKGFPLLEIHAMHVSGEFSCGAGVDESYLKTICSGLDVPLVILQSTQKLETLECYSCSRERRRLIFDAAKKVGCETIAFGHHRDDNAQTLLMNLLHKGEFAGNLPKIKMQEYGVTIIRPLIYIAEKDIRTFAQQQGFARIMCRCPVGQNSMRKQVDQLLTDIETLFPNARENIAQAGLKYGSQKASKP
jgi:tRNA 2-thiocytidine biosynthesis protein TtcA